MKEAKLFMNGRSQAVRLPKEFRMPGESVYIRKSGDSLVLIPKKKGKRSWDLLFNACGKFTDDFIEIMSNRDQGVHEREDMFE